MHNSVIVAEVHASKKVRQGIEVSIQGYLGSFHHLAALKYWGPQIQLLQRSSFAEVYQDLVSGRVEWSLAAIENSIAGVVTESLQELLTQPVVVIDEVAVPVAQNLVVIPGVRIEQLRRVYSHPVALAQCQEFFSQYPAIELIATDDTGKSVERMLERGDVTAGSVASSLAAEVYGAEIVAREIQDSKENETRFLVLQRRTTGVSSSVLARHQTVVARYVGEAVVASEELAVATAQSIQLQQITRKEPHEIVS